MTVATPDMGRDTSAATLRGYNLAIGSLVVVVGGAFALSFHGLLDLLMRVAEIPWWLAWLGPIIIDFFALVGIGAGHTMRDAHWRRRLYAWTVTLLATALSVAGNVADAQAKHLTAVGIGVFAVAPPIIFLSSHLIVVCRREVDERRAAARAETVVVVTPEVGSAVELREPQRMEPEPYARFLARKGWTVKDIHGALTKRGDNVHARTVARWTADLRGQTPAEATA